MKAGSVAVIGAGIAGIAVSIRLALKGYKVDVFEANSTPGGKIQEFYLHDYRFDAGPSLFTMPELVEELYQLAGLKMQDFIPYKKLDIVTRYFYSDKTVIEGYADPELFAKEIAEQTKEEKQTILSYLKESERYYKITSQPFLFQSLHKLSNYIKKGTLSSMAKLPSLPLFSSMHHKNKQWFSDPRVIQLFDRFATYNGSNPYIAPALLNVIPHLEHNKGAFYPEHGIYSIVTGLTDLAKKQGVNFNFNTTVEEIIYRDKKIKGIRINGTEHNYDMVISNMDVVPTYEKLLKHIKKPKIYTDQPRSSSALIFYWAIEDVFPELDLHNILFSDNYKEEFQSIFNNFNVSDDPTVYIYISSKFRKQDAPEGSENWFVMINVPPDEGQDWEIIINSTRESILKKVEKILKKDIRNSIKAEKILNPKLIEHNTSSYKGALYGNSSNNIFSAFLRHPNFSSKIKGLYFCGGSVHPGGGIPLCLASAKIVSDLV